MSEPLLPSASGRWGYPTSFYLILAANLFFFASFQWSYVTLPGFIQRLGGDATHIGLAFGLSTLSAVVVRPAIAPLIDRWGRRVALAVGAGLFALEPILYTLTTSVWPFLAVRLMRGLGIAAFTTAYTALVADLAPEGRRGEAIGLSGVTNNLGMLFMPALGAAVLAWTDYTVHFWAAAGIAALSLLLVLPVTEPEQVPGVGMQPGPGFWAVARRKPVWLASLGGTGLAVAYGAALSFMPPLAEERGLGAAGAYFAAFALAMMAAQAGAGWLSDRVGRRAVAWPGMAAAGLAALGLGLAHSDPALLASGAGLGLSWGLVRAGLDTAVVDAVSGEVRASALGVLYTCFDAGIGLGSFGLGLAAASWGYGAAFYVAATWAAIALVGYLLLGHSKTSLAPVHHGNEKTQRH
jgi:MFS family permease